jgi:two-component system nitrogen regulation sensor histidine kinase GlnL
VSLAAPADGLGHHRSDAEALLDTMAHPVLMVDADDSVRLANDAAELFFGHSSALLQRQKIDHIVPFASPLRSLIDQVRRRGAAVNEYAVDLGPPDQARTNLVDVQVAPVGERPGAVLVMLLERTMAAKIDRQLSHRGAARSVMGLAALLAHEIKNPLSGIRGAAQLLGATVGDDDDRALTQLICDEADRICKLVDRMEIFSVDRPMERAAVNIHAVFDRVRRLAETGFARGIKFVEVYDPSLPPVLGDQDQLIQAFLNLVKNAAEALERTERQGQITLRSAFLPGMRLSVPGARDRVNLPLEFTVADNGPGVPADLAQHLFEPFVTSRPKGGGLGLALVAKIINDHGGVIECESSERGTTFRVLLPMHVTTDRSG